MKNISLILFSCCTIIISFNSCTNPVDTNNSIGWGVIYPSPYYWPVWSKDGKTIAFLYSPIIGISAGGQINLNADSAGIWFVNADGTNQRFVSRIWGEFDLSYDNKWIVFEANRQIFKAPMYVNYIDTTNITQLTTEGENSYPAYSPEGNYIAYQRSYAYPESQSVLGIWLMDSDVSLKKQIFQGNSGYPTWRYIDTSISFFRGVINSDGEVLGDSLWIYKLSSKSIQHILFLSGDNRFPRYSPDGSKIVFQSQINGNVTQICIIDSDGTNFKQLTTYGGEYPSWAPDSKRVVYVKYNPWRLTPYNGTLWILDTSTGEEHQLTYNTNLIIK
ncbi:MAG: TolB family protein [Ignavibacteriaceae bacterium]